MTEHGSTIRYPTALVSEAVVLGQILLNGRADAFPKLPTRDRFADWRSVVWAEEIARLGSDAIVIANLTPGFQERRLVRLLDEDQDRLACRAVDEGDRIDLHIAALDAAANARRALFDHEAALSRIERAGGIA